MKNNINNIFTRICALILGILFILGGCTDTSANTFAPKFAEFSMPMTNNSIDYANGEIPEGTWLSGESAEEVQSIYEKLCTYYGIEKASPKIVQITRAQFDRFVHNGSTNMKACYDFTVKTLFIDRSWNPSSKEDREVIVHEFLHYLSDNGEKRGFIYYSAETEYNRMFNEGATEFLASKFLGYNEDSPYELQELIASQISEVVSSEIFQNAYFSSDDSKIRQIFNESVNDLYPGMNNFEGIDYDPWDELCSNCNTLWAMSILSDSDESYFYSEYAIFAYLEEEVIYFAYKNDSKIKEVKDLLSNFVNDAGITKSTANSLFSYNYLLKLFR